MLSWLRFFRAVNLPTVPGDVLVGVAAVCCGVQTGLPAVTVVAACLAGVFVYMFGLADNDILGAASDVGRPIPAGEISMTAARIARGLCLFGSMVAGSMANLPPNWWIAAFMLVMAVVVYNRTKWSLLMGLCRGLNVLCGGMAVLRGQVPMALVVVFAIWTVYIAAVTKYSEGEELDAARKRFVGTLIGALVYLQLLALLVFMVKPLLVAGAALLLALRLCKRAMPKVSAS